MPDIQPSTVEDWIALEMQDPKTRRLVDKKYKELVKQQDAKKLTVSQTRLQPMPPQQEVWPDGNLAEAEDNEGDAPLFPQGSPI